MESSLIISLLIVGVVEIVGGIPLILKIAPPNRIYGFRTVKTLSNKEIWYQANKFAGKSLLGSGVFILILAGILWPLRGVISSNILQWIVLAGIVAPTGISITASFIHLSRL